MSPQIAIAITCLLATTAPVTGFAPPSVASEQLTACASYSYYKYKSSSSVQMVSSAQHAHATEDTYPQLLNSASICAHSESCSIESAEYYLGEIVYIQGGCAAAGTLSGNNAVCDDVLGVSEIVADLRQKIGEGAKREASTFWEQRVEEMVTLAETSMDGSFTSALTGPIKPAYLAIAALYTIAIISLFQHADTTTTTSGGIVLPFTAQEVWWAIRDGYATDFAHHFFHNGGLAVSDALITSSTSSNSVPQELLSSVGGGGLESDPFTPQEVWWAIQHGYSYDMIAHWVQNGGLVV